MSNNGSKFQVDDTILEKLQAIASLNEEINQYGDGLRPYKTDPIRKQIIQIQNSIINHVIDFK